MRASALIALIGAATLLASLPRPAQAWGPDGHAIIAIIAENRLTPEARQTVKAMLDDASLASVSNWADEIRPLRRETSRWHYVNFADGSKDYIPSRDCQLVPGQGDCILAAIDRAIVDLNKDGGSVDALKFLVHFVGDVHQPFHAVGFERGGNGIRVVAFGNRTNLHSVWDG
ncbi:MAG: S1/P1 nuclease, partial [Bradyrhizobium sp.]